MNKSSFDREALCIETLGLAGRLIIENGGETFRVEETIIRMGHGFHYDHVDCFAIPSGLFITCGMADEPVQTSVLRIQTRGTDLDKVNAVNQISRDVEKGQLSLEAAHEALLLLDRHPSRIPDWVTALGAAISSAGFALMFGGHLPDMGIVFVVALLGWLLLLLSPKLGLSRSSPTLLVSALITLGIILFNRYTGSGDIDVLIPSSLMPFVPGLAMTGAVQDTMRGDTLSGMAYGVRALLTAVLIAAGAFLGVKLAGLIP